MLGGCFSGVLERMGRLKTILLDIRLFLYNTFFFFLLRFLTTQAMCWPLVALYNIISDTVLEAYWRSVTLCRLANKA
jgi:hypothetical protein